MLFQEFSKSFVSGLGTCASVAIVFHLYYTFTKSTFVENTKEESLDSTEEEDSSRSYAQLFEM